MKSNTCKFWKKCPDSWRNTDSASEQEKSEFFTQSVEYFGHAIDQEGIQPLPSKVAAIVKTPAPTNVQELRSFLGLLNYYGKFILNLATIIHPLNELLQTDRKWRWFEECAEAFDLAKKQLISSQLLTEYKKNMCSLGCRVPCGLHFVGN